MLSRFLENMMNRWIICSIVFFLYVEEIVSQANRTLDIMGNIRDGEVPVWIHDHITITAASRIISIWSFNNSTIATLPPAEEYYNYPNPSPLDNIIAGNVGPGSFLILNDVNQTYTGTYQAQGDPDSPGDRYLFHMTVHGSRASKMIYLF